MSVYFSLSNLMQNTLIPSISILEKVLRPIAVYIFLVVLLRIFGKRELAQLNQFDLVVLLCLSNTVQNAIIGNDNSLTGGMIGALTLVAFNYIVVRFIFRHRRLDELFEGKPTKLIEDGKVHRHALAKELLSEADLTIAAYRQNFKSLNDVKTCILAPNGTVTMEPKAPPVEHELMRRLDELTGKIDILLERAGAKD